jgi:putative ABC transport system permease protein
MAVGARRVDILWQFLLEAVGLSIVGGISGVAVGLVASLVISRLANWSLIVEPSSISIAVASSILVGVFFGWYPAFRASRLEPVEAIRSVWFGQPKLKLKRQLKDEQHKPKPQNADVATEIRGASK